MCVAKRGFVPGEPIRFGAEISNMSRRKMGCSSVELKMVSVKIRVKSRLVTNLMQYVGYEKRPVLINRGAKDIFKKFVRWY